MYKWLRKQQTAESMYEQHIGKEKRTKETGAIAVINLGRRELRRSLSLSCPQRRETTAAYDGVDSAAAVAAPDRRRGGNDAVVQAAAIVCIGLKGWFASIFSPARLCGGFFLLCFSRGVFCKCGGRAGNWFYRTLWIWGEIIWSILYRIIIFISNSR